jgi:periplasmic protein CpxP/Spy
MDTHTTNSRFHRRHFWLLLSIPALVLGGLGLVHAQGLGGGPGWGMMWGGPGGDHQAFFQKRFEKMLDSVKATDAQRAAIKPIMEDLLAKMKPIHQQGAAIHDKLLEAFAAPTVDAGVVENLRQQGFKLHDEGSRLFTDALVKIGNVLNVEQRKQVLEHLKEHGPRHHFGR